MRRNSIQLHQRLTGARFEYLNRLNHQYYPVDGEMFVHNVLGYDALPVGRNPFQPIRRGRQKGKSRAARA